MKKILMVIVLLISGYAFGMESYKTRKIEEIKQKFIYLQGNQIDIKDPQWIQLLSDAAFYECIDVLNFLLQIGVNPNDRGENDKRSSALYNACSNRSLKSAIILLNYNANPDLPEPSLNDTPLMVSLRHGFYEIFNLLLEKGANPNFQDKVGMTALMYACSVDHFEDILKNSSLISSNETEIKRRSFIWTLLKAGAKIDFTNIKNKTAIDFANEKSLRDIIELLTDYTPEGPTLKNLCIKFIKKHRKFFKDQDFEILPNELKISFLKHCNTCKAFETNEQKLHRCSKCKKVYYCNVECQKADWISHKRECQNINKN